MPSRRRKRPLLQTLLHIFLFSLATICLTAPSHNHAFAPINAPPPNTPIDPPPSNPPLQAHNAATAPAHSNLHLPRATAGFRNHLDLGAGWNMYYSSWNAIALPVQLASLDLVRLYSTVIANAAGVWRVAPPRQDLQIALGNMQLLWNCAQQPIPWDIVELFGRKLLQITEAGWTGVYRLMLSHAETGVTIVVVARAIEDGYWEAGEKRRRVR